MRDCYIMEGCAEYPLKSIFKQDSRWELLKIGLSFVRDGWLECVSASFFLAAPFNRRGTDQGLCLLQSTCVKLGC